MAARRKGFLSPIAEEKAQDGDAKVHTSSGSRARLAPSNMFTPPRPKRLRKSKKLRSARTVRDPIHNQIDIPGVCWEIIDTPEFQRLRHLKQTGMVFRVYPSAVHSRFEHSLGVCYLAGKWVDHFREVQPDLEITEKDKYCVMLAGLCHDWGHGPYSHVFDGEFIPSVKARSNDVKDDGGGGDAHGWTHEQASQNMIDFALEKNQISLVEYGLDAKDIVFIKELIDPPKNLRRHARGRGASKSFLYEIVSNKICGLDVDKFDYFQRDRFFTGMGTGDLSINYIIKQSRVKVVDGMRQICFPEKCVRQILEIYRARFNLHHSVYQHRVVKSLELMLVDALLLANDHTPIKGCSTIASCIENMEAYAWLNDSILDLIVHRSYNPSLSAQAVKDLTKARKIIEQMRSRRLYKCVGALNLDQEDEISEKATEEELVALAMGLDKQDIIVKISKCHYGAKHDNPLLRIAFFEKNGSEAKEFKENKYETSLPCSFQEEILRVYCRDPNKLDVARDAFARWARQHEAPSPMLTFSQEKL